jgi:hypothetical protein
VADVLEDEQLGRRMASASARPCSNGNIGSSRADHDREWRAPSELPTRRIRRINQIVVGERRLDVRGAIEHPRRRPAHLVLVQRRRVARAGALQLDQVVDHLPAVGPVGPLDCEPRGVLLAH